MLFNSYDFIFFFLPLTLSVFFFIGKYNKQRLAMSWLVLCSLFFYGWWNPAYLVLILFSMLFNYAVGTMLSNGDSAVFKKYLLWFGITLNLSFLGYYKYFNFFIEQVNLVSDSTFHLDKILLPLAISFFTFQQIAYLVDAYRHETREYNFLHYCLFVTFFPQLIAGPIVHHKEMMPQFAQNHIYKFKYKNLAIGLTIFTIGLFKKVIFADGVAVYASPVFSAAEAGVALTFFEAWGGALAYTLQLYFDFSGYSDMAMGIAFMFGIKLPLNFNSPYKAQSIIEFWRRWHMTLSRFLRDYLYFALGGNKKGNARRYVNLFLTMLLGGIWHGAGWTFIVWGLLHGSYLMVNHAWRKVRYDLLKWSDDIGVLETIAARALTLLAVIIGWVYFRAETVSGANHLVATMFAFNGISLPANLAPTLGEYSLVLNQLGITFNGMFGGSTANLGEGIKWILCLILLALFLPNSVQIQDKITSFENQYNSKIFSVISQEKLANSIALLIGLCFGWVLIHLSRVSEFLYFQF